MAESNFDACSVKLGFCEGSETKTIVELIPISEAGREGRRRSADDWSYTLDWNDLALSADRGFTGHEYLPWFNPYNMNGRMYDPLVGRFLSADPFIQDPASTQNYNRYSYCMNNPLKFTDPSGNKWKWPKFEWRHLIPVIGQLDYVMQTVNDNTEGVRQKMADAGVPDFNVGGTVNLDGNVNFNGSIYGQEVFNTANKDRSNAVQVVNKEIAQVNQDYGEEWHGSGKGGEPKDGNWGFGTYLSGTFAPCVGPTVEIGCVVDSKGHALNYLSIGIAVGVEASAGGGAIVVPYKDFSTQSWLGDGFGGAFNIPMTPFSLEYAQSMYNTTYRAGKFGLGVGIGGSANWTYTIILPVVPPYIWARPGQPR